MVIVPVSKGMVPEYPLGRRNLMSPQHHNVDVEAVSATTAQPASRENVVNET
jgi:hypothetical protein